METSAAHFLSQAYVEGEFNATTPDAADVQYLSFGGALCYSSEYWAPFMPLERLLRAHDGPNDGLVSVRSSRWGEYVATVSLDHVEQINFPLKLWRNEEGWRLLWRRVFDLC